MAAIEQGIVTTTTKARLLELEAEWDQCHRELAAEGEPKPAPALHPNLPEVYRRKVAKLEEALNDPLTKAEAVGAIRTLIDAVVLHPGERRGEALEQLGVRPVLDSSFPLDQLTDAFRYQASGAHLGKVAVEW